MKRSRSVAGASALAALVGLLFSVASGAQTLGSNLALTGPGAGADGSGFSNTKTVRDGDLVTYSQASGTSNQRVSVKWSSAINFNTVVLRESGNNVSSWQLVNNQTGAVLATGTTIGASRTVNLGNVSMNKVNLIVSGSSPLRIAEFEVYNATGTPASSSAPASSSSSQGSGSTITYQASQATLSQAKIDNIHSGFSGNGFIDFDNLSGSYAQWTVNQSAAGSATLTVRYANGSTNNRIMAVRVNNGSAVNMNFPGTGAWNGWSTQSITVTGLNAGNNTIRLTSTTSDGGPNVDRIELSGGSGVPASSSSAPASSSVPASSSSSAPSSAGSSSSTPGQPGYSGPISNDCITLATNPNVNWRQTSLQSDQAIVECLSQTLGRPVGYGENALGGYNPNGGSKLTIITRSGSVSVEQQILNAIADDSHNWIVFDKFDFAQSYEIGMYRSFCSNSTVLNHLNATQAQCINYRQWCNNRGFTGESQCLEEFFNKSLNNNSLPIRNPVVGSNKTIDGRMSNAYFRFSGFSIGQDSSGQPSRTSNSVIFTHLDFRGAGHTEDHYLDPDMIRSTGASSHIWIHKNTFDTTGDSAFDVKVGARNITMSFNRIVNVKRAALHGSSDSRVINENITTTMHHNAFVTRDADYRDLGNALRRVPLIRRGTSHMFSNLFVNYRKDILSIRVGARVLWENNALVVNQSLQEKSSVSASLDELQSNLIRDISGGSFRAEGVHLWFSDGACNINSSTQRTLTQASGTVANLSQQYSVASRNTINANHLPTGQQLIDYVSATAGKHGQLPFNSPLAGDPYYVLGLGKVPCQ